MHCIVIIRVISKKDGRPKNPTYSKHLECVVKFLKFEIWLFVLAGWRIFRSFWHFDFCFYFMFFFEVEFHFHLRFDAECFYQCTQAIHLTKRSFTTAEAAPTKHEFHRRNGSSFRGLCWSLSAVARLFCCYHSMRRIPQHLFIFDWHPFRDPLHLAAPPASFRMHKPSDWTREPRLLRRK